MMKRFMLATGLAAMLVMFSAGRANALCALCTCSVASSGINFQTYDPLLASNTNVNGNIRVTCSLGGLVALLVAYEIRLAPGGSGNFAQRELSRGASKLRYNLYTSAARSTIWGDGSGSTQAVIDGYLLALGAPTAQDYTVYGQIPQLQNVVAGAYTDSMVITVIY